MILGMIHLPNLRYNSKHSIDSIIEQVKREIDIYQTTGYDAVMIENFNDTPFDSIKVDEIVIAKLSAILHQIQEFDDIKVGLNILRNASEQAMNLACLYNLDFIRSNIWEGAYITDQGIINGCARNVIEIRNKWDKPVKVMADVYVKHATPMGDFSIDEAALNAYHRGNADYIVVSGRGTGRETSVEDIKLLNDVGIKPIIGSGLTVDNISKYAPYIGGAIVGTAVKKDSIVNNSVDPSRAEKLVNRWAEEFR